MFIHNAQYSVMAMYGALSILVCRLQWTRVETSAILFLHHFVKEADLFEEDITFYTNILVV